MKQLFLWIKKPQTQYFKTLLAIIINIWLLIIFWKIFIIEGSSNIVSNNKLLSTIEEAWLYPLFSFFNLEVKGLDPDTIKMLILTFIIISVNLIVLAFNHMLILGVLIGLTRYLYKMYINIKDQVNIVNTSAVGFIINEINSQYNWVTAESNSISDFVINTVNANDNFRNITVNYLQEFSNIVTEAFVSEKITMQLKKSFDAYDQEFVFRHLYILLRLQLKIKFNVKI